MQRLCDQHFQATTDARCGRTLFKASQTFRIYSSKSWKTSKSEQIWFENNRKTQLRVHIRLTVFPGLKKLTLYVQKGSPAAEEAGKGCEAGGAMAPRPGCSPPLPGLAPPPGGQLGAVRIHRLVRPTNVFRWKNISVFLLSICKLKLDDFKVRILLIECFFLHWHIFDFWAELFPA